MKPPQLLPWPAFQQTDTPHGFGAEPHDVPSAVALDVAFAHLMAAAAGEPTEVQHSSPQPRLARGGDRGLLWGGGAFSVMATLRHISSVMPSLQAEVTTLPHPSP